VAVRHNAFDVTAVDLAETGLPFHDEPNHPKTGIYLHEHTLRWSRIVDAADAFVLVTPEYNYGYSPVLKNALDYPDRDTAAHAVLDELARLSAKLRG
jgi:NAD(P)H-dependent FMN reductase